ncbi:MAG: MFS transporter [Conexivisphaerales archaeon]
MTTSYQKSIILSTSSSFFLWGIISTVGPLAASGSLVGSLAENLKILFLLIGPIFMLVGNTTMGYVSDHIGRKRTFIITMAAYAAGLSLIVAFTLIKGITGVASGLALSQFGIGGEEPPSLSLLTEDFSPDARTQLLALVPNFSNIGTAFITGLMVVLNVNPAYLIMLSTAVLVGILIYSRITLPESFRWLSSKGYTGKAMEERNKLKIDNEGVRIKHPGFTAVIVALALIGISQYLTFGLMAYVIGPYEFPSSTFDEEIIFIATLGASLGGPIAAKLVRNGRKNFTLYSYMGGFASMIFILLLVGFMRNLFVFLPLLFFNMIMSEFGWVSRTTLEPETFPTELRSTGIGLIRVFPMVAYIASIYLTSSLNAYQFILFNLILWAIGLLGALVWYYFGFETGNISADYIKNK